MSTSRRSGTTLVAKAATPMAVHFSSAILALFWRAKVGSVYRGMHWAYFSCDWELGESTPEKIESISHKEFDHLWKMYSEMLNSKLWDLHPSKWEAKGKKRAAKKNIGKDNS